MTHVAVTSAGVERSLRFSRYMGFSCLPPESTGGQPGSVLVCEALPRPTPRVLKDSGLGGVTGRSIVGLTRAEKRPRKF